MKKLLVAAIAAACAFGATGAASGLSPEPSFNRTVYVVNHSTAVSDAEVANDLPAFQAGINDLEKYWGGSVRLVQASAIPYRAWGIDIEDDSPVLGALGYHELANGVPHAIVAAGLSKSMGYSWTVTLSHEADEMLVDPFVRRMDWIGGDTFYLVEVGDPVEDDTFGYDRPAADGKPVLLSDFVTDQWYRSGGKGGRFDYTSHVKRSLNLLAGGYVSYMTNGRWQQSSLRKARLFTVRRP